MRFQSLFSQAFCFRSLRHLCICVCVSVCARASIGAIIPEWRSEDNLKYLVLSAHCVGSEDGSKHLYPF